MASLSFARLQGSQKQNKIAEKDQDLTDFKKQRAYDVSFKFPPGLLAKVFFAVGTLLGITIAYNAYYRKSTRDQYKQEKAVFKQAIQTEVTKLNEMYKFRAETLTDNTNIPFHVWLNQAFVDKGSSTNERARAVLSELFHIQP